MNGLIILGIGLLFGIPAVFLLVLSIYREKRYERFAEQVFETLRQGGGYRL
jgi:hypothetical protein